LAKHPDEFDRENLSSARFLFLDDVQIGVLRRKHGQAVTRSALPRSSLIGSDRQLAEGHNSLLVKSLRPVRQMPACSTEPERIKEVHWLGCCGAMALVALNIGNSVPH
jgi:hypothetical protein